MTVLEFQEHLTTVGYDYVFDSQKKRIRIYPKIYPTGGRFLGAVVFNLLALLGCEDYFVTSYKDSFYLVCDFSYL